MNWLEALILGLLQGFTEYLPISSSGHLTIASNFVGLTDPEEILPFTVLLHVATVLSTIVILYKEINKFFVGFEIFTHFVLACSRQEVIELDFRFSA